MDKLGYELFREFLWMHKWKDLRKYSTVHIVIIQEGRSIEAICEPD